VSRVPLHIAITNQPKTMITNTMTTITTATTFQERMFERVRESLSDLLTPEEAKALVEKAIDQSLFQPKLIPAKNYYEKDRYEPSRFEELVKEAVEPVIKSEVEKWLSEHHEEVKASIQEVVERGIATNVLKVFEMEMQQPLAEMGGKLCQVINKLGGI
jgi:TPP-dependent indolepyruvate ferredoxin oxidoreductase alpha subunit